MPWVFIGVETICYLIIFLLFIFMGVEKFGKLDHDAIVADQKAAAKAEGRAYVSAVEKIRLEEGPTAEKRMDLYEKSLTIGKVCHYTENAVMHTV